MENNITIRVIIMRITVQRLFTFTIHFGELYSSLRIGATHLVIHKL